MILVVTDAGTHQRDLEESIKEKAAAKNIKIFIMFYPRCHSRRFCGESMPAYESVSEGRIFNGSDFDNENFFESVLNTVRNIYLLGDDVFKEVLNTFQRLIISPLQVQNPCENETETTTPAALETTTEGIIFPHQLFVRFKGG